jgi:hypothetical protein
MLPTPLAPLCAYAQFVVWRLVDGKKLPFSPVHGGLASSTNPADWGTYEQAAAVGAGVGFVFTERDPFWFLDIDGAWSGSSWSPVALEICAALTGAAVEVSQSGTGLHLIGSGKAPEGHANKNIPLHLELYTKERFVALTGTNATGDAATELTAQLAPVAAKFFTRSANGARAENWTTEPCAEWAGPADDDTLLERAMRSQGNSAQAAFGSGAVTFADLFTADVDVLGAKWPSSTGGAYDGSAADQSFANMLAFWTGKDCERMERLMRLSALARPKWDDHATYLQNTILNACGTVGAVYNRPERETVTIAPPTEPTSEGTDLLPRGGGLMLKHDQENHFAGCVYVNSVNRVMTRTGDLLDQARFNVQYGGHEFVIDSQGKKTTRSAWDALTNNENHAPVIADRICFRPEYGTGGIVRDGGKTLVNSYFPVPPDPCEGDPSKFINHLKRMLPHGEDCELLLGWMATAVQNPGEKLQWWPVVQGAEGNFKSFIHLIMERAVGSHYSHMPNMKKMVEGTSSFNGWIDRKLYLGLEEVYAANRREFFEGFKTTVTNLSIPIEGKGIEETTGDNRVNGVITMNHQDGVPVLGVSRRFTAFFCAQQTPEDMLRDGMDTSYVIDLKDWLLGLGDYAHHGRHYGLRVMAWHLHNRRVEARHNPLRMMRAPETSSTEAARRAGLGRVEQEILEAIEADRPGFAGGWVSSTALDNLLSTSKATIARNKRRETMKALGFDYHPALADGRVHSIVQPDNARPRLYIKDGHISRNIDNPTEAARAYTKAQDKTASEATAAAFGKGA